MSRVDISYVWDRETYLDATKIAYDYELKNSPKRFLGWFFIGMSQFGVVQAMKGGGIGLLLLSSLLILYWYYFRWEIRKYLAMKGFDKLPNANHEFNIVITREGLTIDDRLIEWSKILEMVSFKSGFLLYYEDTFLFFPTKAFGNIETKNRVGLLASVKVKNYKRAE